MTKIFTDANFTIDLFFFFFFSVVYFKNNGYFLLTDSYVSIWNFSFVLFCNKFSCISITNLLFLGSNLFKEITKWEGIFRKSQLCNKVHWIYLYYLLFHFYSQTLAIALLWRDSQFLLKLCFQIVCKLCLRHSPYHELNWLEINVFWLILIYQAVRICLSKWWRYYTINAKFITFG